MARRSKMDIILEEEKKCNEDILQSVINLLKNKKTVKDIMTELNMSAFVLSTYLEVAFYREQTLDPSLLVDKNLIENIMRELNKSTWPSLTSIKELFNCDYSEIRIVRGVYFRTNRFFSRKKPSEPKKEETQVVSFFDTMNISDVKVDIDTVPFLREAINNLKTSHWRKFAIELFSKYTPKQFYIMPASMKKGVHNETEHTTGYFDLNDTKKLVLMGGKCYHSIRVYEMAKNIIDTDAAEIWDFKKTKVTDYVYGNEYSDAENDIILVAALSHDIFSGGTDDEFNYKRKSLDKMHPYYHKEALLPIKDIVPNDEWELYIRAVQDHMWKWSPNPLQSKFHDGKKISEEAYKFYSEYRVIKTVEIADYLGSRKDSQIIPKFTQAIKTFYYLIKSRNITWDELEKMGIEEKEVRVAYGKMNEPLSEFLKLILDNNDPNIMELIKNAI